MTDHIPRCETCDVLDNNGSWVYSTTHGNSTGQINERLPKCYSRLSIREHPHIVKLPQHGQSGQNGSIECRRWHCSQLLRCRRYHSQVPYRFQTISFSSREPILGCSILPRREENQMSRLVNSSILEIHRSLHVQGRRWELEIINSYTFHGQ
jgi:hypothetical protein